MSGGLGRVQVEGGRVALRFERAYAAPPEEVWAALTEPSRSAAGCSPTRSWSPASAALSG